MDCRVKPGNDGGRAMGDAIEKRDQRRRSTTVPEQ
jgi:hypothetical protein